MLILLNWRHLKIGGPIGGCLVFLMDEPGLHQILNISAFVGDSALPLYSPPPSFLVSKLISLSSKFEREILFALCNLQTPQPVEWGRSLLIDCCIHVYQDSDIDNSLHPPAHFTATQSVATSFIFLHPSDPTYGGGVKTSSWERTPPSPDTSNLFCF